MRIRGSYAMALLFKDYPEQIWVARKDSPMIIGVQDEETYMASDVPAILSPPYDGTRVDSHEYLIHFVRGAILTSLNVGRQAGTGRLCNSIYFEKSICSGFLYEWLFCDRHFSQIGYPT